METTSSLPRSTQVPEPAREVDLPALRRRLQAHGESRLSDFDCLRLLLGPGRAAGRVWNEYGGLVAMAGVSAPELRQRLGLGPAAASQLVVAFGLARRLAEARFQPGQRVGDAGDLARLVREVTRGSRRESFLVFLLDARHRLRRSHEVSLGCLTSAPVHPREVFGPAVREAAAAVLVAHNHPSGEARPSPEDRQVTERLRAAGELLGIPLLDHVVVGADRCYSFCQEAYVVLS